MKRYIEKIVLLGILLLAGILRFVGVNWDQGQHLHPDERFLTMVGNAMHIPASFSQYLNPQTSPMNPANINFNFYVYGLFPVTFNKVLAVLFGTDAYQEFTLQGRVLSGFFDFITILLVYKTVELLERRHNAIHPQVKYFAAFLYAIAVLPIQLSHFFAVDTFLNTFLFASFYCALRYWSTGSLLSFFMSMLLLSLAIASKVNAVLIIPLNAYFLATGLFMREHGQWLKTKNHHYFIKGKKLFYAFLFATLGIILAYITLRIADPYLFESKSFLDFHISKLFLQNIQTLNSWNNAEVWFPPGVQWISKPPVTFALFNLAFFGVGLPYFIFIALGFFLTFRNKNLRPLAIALVWVLIFFFYQSVQFVKNMRYFIIIYPFFAITAAIGMQAVWKRSTMWLRAIVLIAVLIWPLAYFSIYTRLQSRVQASQWIYRNIPNGSHITYEHWDDPLPLNLPEGNVQQYIGQDLPVFDPDTPEKWQKITTTLAVTDYYILSSNRAWGSIPTVPKKYPLGSKFYADLFAGKLEFVQVKEFTSYPSLRYLGIPLDLPDDAAEESFTVYDHPQVIIFQKKK